MYFCLNVTTSREEEAKTRITKLLETSTEEEFLVWFPKKEVREKRQGRYESYERPLFPSYLFIYWNGDNEMFFPLHEIRRLPTVIRILGYDDGTHNLKGKDLSFAKWIHMHDGFIEQSKVVYREGQKLRIVEGPLKGMDGNVVKVDKHHKRITLRFEIGDNFCDVSFTVSFLDSSSVSDAPNRTKL